MYIRISNKTHHARKLCMKNWNLLPQALKKINNI